jgi:PIN domain nuclease of toxin-antitoxin system
MLLDTNAFIWFVEGNTRLKAPLRAAIADPTIPVKLSIVSFWEMAIKHRKGKLPLPAPFAEDPALALEHWRARAVIDLVPLEPRHIARAMRLDFPRDDPFDRLIAAVALTEDQELVTSDKRFALCVGLRVLLV